MEFKGRDERTKCYATRDAYFGCIEKQPEGTDAKAACKELFDKFEMTCGMKWTEHFIRRRDYLKFKERVEKEGVNSIDGEKFKKL